MQVAWGQSVVELEIPQEKRIPLTRAAEAPPISDVAAAVREALEKPYEFPPLRRALTPEDRVVVVVEPEVPHTGVLLTEALGALTRAGVQTSAITLICPDVQQDQSWIDDLPDAFAEVRIETHQPDERKALAYLATTRKGRRVYLNRSLVDADQIVVVTRRRYDPRLGYAGAAAALFPGLCETETAHELKNVVAEETVDPAETPLHREAEEVAYLLGVPFFLQIIGGPGDSLIHVVGGSHESGPYAESLLDAAWCVSASEPADLVVATLTGEGHSFADIARAGATAARLVRPAGRIVILSDDAPDLGPAEQIVRDEEDLYEARQRLLKEKPTGFEAAASWTRTCQKAQVYLLSRLPIETAEELHATALDRVEQCARLLAAAPRVIVIPDAHRTRAALASEKSAE